MLSVSIGFIVLVLVVSILAFSCAGKEGDRDGGATNGIRTTSPLTGLPLRDGDSANRRAVAVKVENHPDARPQSGLDLAEVVYEELVEGGVTRFIAVYLDEDAAEIGPVRSARPMDAGVLACIDPLFAVSGGSPQVMQTVMRDIHVISEAINETADFFFRTRDRRAPHNLYTSTDLLRSYCDHVGLGERDWSGDLFRFGDTPDAEECHSIDVGYPGTCAVTYEYDAATGNYPRSMAGNPHTDKNSGARIAPTTVIVQYVELEDTGVRDMAGDLSPDAVVVGSGKAEVFTGGKVIHGTWMKDDISERTRYLREDGDEITIEPGQVWIHLVPRSIRVSYDVK